MNRRRVVPLLAAAVGVVAVGAAVAIFARVGVPGTDQLRGVFGGGRWWQPVLFAGLYSVATLTPLPKAVLSVAAGAIFGVPLGLLVVLASATAGALAAFTLTRTLARGIHRPGTAARHVNGRVRQLLMRYRGHTDGLYRLFEDRGLLTVTALRLVPVVPFTAVNYVAGLTRVRASHFTAGTVVGMLPATAAYVTLGAYGARPGSWPVLASVTGLLLLAVAGICLKRVHRRTEISPPRSHRQVDRRGGSPAAPLTGPGDAEHLPANSVGDR